MKLPSRGWLEYLHHDPCSVSLHLGLGPHVNAAAVSAVGLVPVRSSKAAHQQMSLSKRKIVFVLLTRKIRGRKDMGP